MILNSRLALIPTQRAVLSIAALALVAVMIGASSPGAWVIAPMGGAAILLLTIGDALLGWSAASLEVTARSDIEVGVDEALALSAPIANPRARNVAASLEGDVRLLDHGRADIALRRGEAGWGRLYPVKAARRGTAALTRGWLRWTGPLGLGAWQAVLPLTRHVRIWPNVAAVRSPALQAFLRDAQFGLIARRIRGEGAEFEALTDYHPGMDRRRIDWKASARHVHLYAKEYETERNNQIVFAFDCGQAMCEPVAGMARLDRAISAALATAYVALKGGDRVALYGFAARPQAISPFVSDARDFRRLQHTAAGFEYHAEEPNFTLALATLAGRLQRRSLIVVFSDFTDPTSAELMVESIARLVRRHLVLFVTLADEELESIAGDNPADLQALAMAVGADGLLKQRALVHSRLRQMGVEVIEAPHDRFGTRVIDAYLAIKRKGAIG